MNVVYIKAGTKPIENITKKCSELGVKVLTFYVFSTENWSRSNEEVGNLNVDKINEDLISNYMLTSGLPDADLVIRTSGEMRISNFLLWQSAKSKLWFTNDFWPDFNYNHLKEAIKYFNVVDS